MKDQGFDPQIAESLRQGFNGRPTVSFSEAAKLLKCNEKTLRKHIADGNIAYRNVGLGLARPRREFALADLVGFYTDSARRHGKDADRGVVRTAARGLTGFSARRAERVKRRAAEAGRTSGAGKNR